MSTNMRLADFIRAEIEPILEDWEEFAKTILPRYMGKTELRDHAQEMLLEIADDLESYQSDSEQAEKSKGREPKDDEESSAEVHGGDRHASGFSVLETVSEFRALRASVVSHWTNAHETLTGQQLEDLTRFHEAIDQSVSESLEQYAIEKEMETRLFGAILLASPDPIYVLDLEGRFAYANKATADLFALAPEAIIGKTTVDLGFPFASDFERDLEKAVTNQSTYRGKFVHTFASGRGERFEYVLAPVLDEQGNTEATVCIFRDVTEQALAEERIWHSAHHDLLTGLPNRRLFLDRLEQELKHARRRSLPLSVLFMDLNGFKEVNDSLGHEAGDRLLSDVAARLTNCVREEDTVARMGGDEFTVILTGAKQGNGAERVAQSITDALVVPFQTGAKQGNGAERVAQSITDALVVPFQAAQKTVQISVSIGISSYPRDATSPVDLLEAADQAMYEAKKAGSDQR